MKKQQVIFAILLFFSTLLIPPVTWAVHQVSVSLPIGELQVQSQITSAFPEIDSSEWWINMPPVQRKVVANYVYPAIQGGKHEWPTRDLAIKRGLFDPAVLLTATMERFANHDYNTGFPAKLSLPTRISIPTVIKVFSSQDAMLEKAIGWIGHEGKNAYYDPQSHEIGIVIDDSLLIEMFPKTELLDIKERAGRAADALRRTILLGFVHELVHHMQAVSGSPLYLCPLIAEGQATFLAQRSERTEVLFPIIASQFLFQMKRKEHSIESILSATKKRRQDIMLGEVKLLEEYIRLHAIRQWYRPSDGEILGPLLCASRRKFDESAKVNRNYDMSWLLFQYICQSDLKDREEWIPNLCKIVTSLDWRSHNSTVIHLENELNAYLQKECPEAGDIFPSVFAEAVGMGDRFSVQGKYFDQYLLLSTVARRDPDNLVLLPYFGDFFFQHQQRDRFFFYYRDTWMREAETHETRLSGRIRTIWHYIEALIQIGHIESAGKLVQKHAFVTADHQALQAICLREKWFAKCQEANWSHKEVARLSKEHDLGRMLIGLHGILNSTTVKSAVTKNSKSHDEQAMKQVLIKQLAFIKNSVKVKLKQLGYNTIPLDAWFVLDFQIIDKSPDFSELLKNQTGQVTTDGQ